MNQRILGKTGKQISEIGLGTWQLGTRWGDPFNREEALLNGDEVHNITSDIIESTFGCFKARMSPNKSNGYTSLVLLIPLSLKVSTIEDCRNFNVIELLGKTTITDIKKWRGDNLLPNPTIKRMNVVKNAA